MYNFKCDYAEGAAPEILQSLVESNMMQSDGYGMDDICEEARNRIRESIHQKDADVHFLVGGTQANLTVIASALLPYEACIAVESGHINTHETGAIEATGHKVICVKGNAGKITPEEIEKVVLEHRDEHMVKPKLVYISNATEIGTIYTKKELEDISSVCHKYDLYLFMDGARLGAALCADGNDMVLKDIANYCDVFYIGGTKNGALFGEAVIIVNDALKQHFRYHVKQRGALLAKGRLLGIQFNELFKNDLFFRLANHADQMAKQLSQGMKKLGCSFMIETMTNQIFVVLDNMVIKELEKNYGMTFWEAYDERHSIMRIVTSWATSDEAVDAFLSDLKALL